ncbi:hypothetical protein [Microbacterium sp. CJ88]|uniref:hypothetical protein n=1 Tax=Microbacterium sp. CJ88 TaxID=3445672 RepID=UPI003F65D246
MTETTTPTFRCIEGRHKVLAGDGICVLCGRRGVTDARALSPTIDTPSPPAPPPLVDPDPEATRIRALADELTHDHGARIHLAATLASERDGGTRLVRELLRRLDKRK